ncbi:MAG: hypothetical protein IPK32_15290 [Verrucomicrobiaceae bacterium]|nr:hypothetical protein [Verrucomicrobiaceae bacterium]
MKLSLYTKDSLKSMSRLQRESLKPKLDAYQSKILAEVDSIKRIKNLIRVLEDIPGYKTVNEYIEENQIELTTTQRSKVGFVLKKGANRQEWEQGQKTVETKTKARQARQPTYDPKIIKKALRDVISQNLK